MSNNIAIIEQAVYSVEQTFSQVCADPSINFKKEAEFSMQIICKSDFAMNIAARNPQSVRDAVTNVAAIGISLNPAKRQAYLVPMDGAIQLQISYMGLVEIAVASGSIRFAKAELVRRNDSFRLNGLDKEPTHVYDPFGTERGDVVGVYSVVKTRDGDWITGTMPIAEINAIRDRSSAWKAWISKQKKCPWVTDESEMQKKTIIKRDYKMWPRSDRLDKAIHFMNTEGGEGIDLNDSEQSPAPSAPQYSVGNILARIDAAETIKDLSDVRKEGQTAASANRDKLAYDRITRAAKNRRDQLLGVSDAEPVGAAA